MAKDPRFNFYPDNWIGGTEGFTLEQEGAYLSLIIMQSKVGRFTKDQAIDKLMQKTRGNTAVCTELWHFLIPKFDTDGNLFWNERLEKEIEKSKRHSKLQSERVKKRFSKNDTQSGTQSGITAVIPVYGIGNGNINKRIESAFHEIYLDQEKMKWTHVDFNSEFDSFCNKIRGSPDKYSGHDEGALRLALQYHLRSAKSKQKTEQKNRYKIQ